jgi:small-conductance mechanosensitive channel
LLLLLNESIAFCRRRGLPVERTMRNLRNLVVPAAALLVFVRFVLELPQSSTGPRLVESAFWILLLYTLLGVVNDLVFGGGGPGSLGERVPKLFRDLVRALLVAIGAMVVYSQVWGHEVSAALTALGLGSIVIGLALQEPLGNIVSGLMLLSERPLNVGDWIQVGGVRGRVIEINWRAVHIETPTRELQVIPNVELYKGTFANLSRPTPLRTEVIEMGFSYDDAPNRVKEVMIDLMRTTPGVFVLIGSGNEQLGTTHGVHTPLFKLDESVLSTGAAMHVMFARAALEQLRQEQQQQQQQQQQEL